MNKLDTWENGKHLPNQIFVERLTLAQIS